ncbi:DNA polymerase III subunit alpha [Patescibacteria group bacterium]|nr:DNA polymerase III subunit alpha [Patescibacteria group bacterium]
MFVHLHTHSHYSLLDGLAKLDDLIAKAKAENMPALALTDHGVMYGIVEFYQKCKAAGIKPILGVEAYLARNGRQNKRARIDERPYHLILLAKNKIGYQNLIKITSIAHLEGFYYKPRIDWEVLEKYHEGLVALSACLQGEIPASVLNGDLEKTKELILKYQNIFGPENFYLEIQHHPSSEEQKTVNRELINFSKTLGIPLVATNDIHYLNSEDDEAQDVLLCLQTKRKITDKDRMCMLGEDYSMRPTARMEEDFKDNSEAISNTLKIAEMCNVELELGNIMLPHFEVPDGKTANAYLRELCERGLEKRYGIIKVGEEFRVKDGQSVEGGKADVVKVIERLNYELSVIDKTGFASYFLIVQDFVNWAKNNGIVVGPGRGSAAGSIVSYLTNITNIDPLLYNLLFERFLNPERISMPDIDLDFTDTRRDEVIRYVEGKYGRDHVAQIITFGTMAARAAIRDAGRVLDFPYSFCDQLAKLIPLMFTLDEALKNILEFRELYDKDPGAKKLIDTARKLEGVARHASTHACGVVITKNPLDHHTPLQFASSGDQTVVSQYSLHPIEDLGLLKMDFLGLKNLTILENTLGIIEKIHGEKVHTETIPLQDEKTFALLRKGDTTGVFQLESSGMKRYLRELKPTIFEDIIAMVALYRPGPMDWIPSFIAGKNSNKKIKYLHPKLEPILSTTHGIAVYQEQVLQIARDLAGFTLGEADILRKAVGKKIAKLLAEQKEKFISGCVKNDISKETAENVFAFIEPFAGYGFNRSHAACYARIAYETAYFKANYPAEFMASLLTSDHGDIERIAVLVEECKQMKIEVMPPDINESFSTFTVVAASLAEGRPRIRFGLLAVKNVGENIVKTIIRERKENGVYKNLEDFLTRVQTKDLNKKSLESLIKCGAMDRFGERNQMLVNSDRLLNFTKDLGREAASQQTSLFGIMATSSGVPTLRLDPAPEATKEEKLSWEKEHLGLYISEHPLTELSGSLREIVVACSALNQCPPNTKIKIAGVINEVKKVITRSGEPMLFAKIEDVGGSTELLVFPKALKNMNDVFQTGRIILASGRLSDKDGEMKLICEDAKEINKENITEIVKRAEKTNGNFYHVVSPAEGNGAPKIQNASIALSGSEPPSSSDPKAVCIRINSLGTETTQKLKDIFFRYKGDHRVLLSVLGADGRKKIQTDYSVAPNDECREALEELIGKGNIQILGS